MGLARVAVSFAARRMASRIAFTSERQISSTISSKIRSEPGIRSSTGKSISDDLAELAELGLGILLDEYFEAVEEIEMIISDAASDAVATMNGLVANEGQLSVFESAIIPAFMESLGSSSLEDGWTPMETEYDEFVGGIVEEGNQIMSDAYDEASDIASEFPEIKAPLELLLGLWWPGDEERFGINPFSPGSTLTEDQKISKGGILRSNGVWQFPKGSYYKNSNFPNANGGY